jgi:8-oxo-dGTP pyrophosphatase MutT (NUDIX family)
MTYLANLTPVIMPLESDGRPVYERPTARVVVLDPDNRALLINEVDPAAPGRPSYWLTPGGGIETGESPREAAVRELDEEIGLRISADDLRGPIAKRTVIHGFSDRILVQPETFFVVRTHSLEVTPNGLTAIEKQVLLGHKWWSASDLRETAAMIWPAGLVTLVIAHDSPSAWPVSLSTAQESTVPVGD